MTLVCIYSIIRVFYSLRNRLTVCKQKLEKGIMIMALNKTHLSERNEKFNVFVKLYFRYSFHNFKTIGLKATSLTWAPICVTLIKSTWWCQINILDYEVYLVITVVLVEDINRFFSIYFYAKKMPPPPYCGSSLTPVIMI